MPRHRPGAQPPSGRRRTLAALGAGAAGAALGGLAKPALAQAWPDRPVKIVVGFPPGGTNDILARLIGARLQERLKQGFVVENKPGASSAVGNDAVAKSRPDGYTLLVSSSGGLTVNPVLMANLAYDPEKDFDPIALLGTFPLIVTVPASLPVNSLAQLVDYAKKAKNGTLDHGVATTAFQLVAETLASATGIRFNHVNYRGSAPVVTALMGGEIQVGVLDSAAVMSQVKAGKLRALAVSTGRRASALPELPTVAEAIGSASTYDVPIWTALMAPRGTPPEILATLRRAVGEILAEKDTIEKMQGLGLDPGNVDAPALARRISSDIARWREVARAANIKPE